ncbi:MAG: DUF11 domain-containing protein [Chlamydiae bacterium]|nr:DUF11 domain-containing protein [Chlamydiota bacterium]MBI3277965.1 DUF11 domain-containing protein [Chlamydiota bacterium]
MNKKYLLAQMIVTGWLFWAASLPIQASTNLLQNSSFESGTGTGSGSSFSNWTIFGNDTSGCPSPNNRIFAQRDGSGNEHSGSFSLRIASDCGPPSSDAVAGVFQDITSGFGVGDTVTLQAFAKFASGDATGELHFKIEFIGTSIVKESGDFATSSSYSSPSLQATVPSGTTAVRATIIQVMKSGSSSTGTSAAEYFIDDVSMAIDKQSSSVSVEGCSFPTNASFEDTGIKNEEILPGWTRFPFESSLVNQKDNSSLVYLALDGTHAVEMNIFGGQFTGIFEVITGIHPGETLDFSAYARTDNTDFGAFGQLKIEFKDVKDRLISDTLSDKITKNNASGDYKKFSISAVAPTGTTYAVLVLVGDAGQGGGGDIVFDAVCSNFQPTAKITGDVFNVTNGQLITTTHVELLRADGSLIETDSNNPFEFFVEPDSYRMLRASAEGYTFPSRINQTVIQGDHGDLFHFSGDTKISLPMDPGYPLILKKDVNKKEAARGDLLVYKFNIKNNSTLPIDNVLLIDDLPDSFRYRSGTSQKNGEKIADPSQNGSLTFNLGTLKGSEEVTISYVAVIGTKAEPGRQYLTTAVAKSSSLGWQLSNTSLSGPTVILEPIFDLGTMIGKVFNDQNKNGVQDHGEQGIPDVRLATEEGTVIYTDAHGKYHIPGVKPGRHIIKIDRHSLPPGAECVTEEAYLVKITEGLLSKVNFAIALPLDTTIPPSYQNELEVHVTQQYDKVVPHLEVSLNQENFEILADQFVQPAYFYIEGNYLDLAIGWKIIIRDDRDKIIRTLGLTGEPAIPSRVEWDGKNDDGIILDSDRNYTYQLIITDGTHEDWTDKKPFKTTAKKEHPIEVRQESFMHLEENQTARQSIPITNRNSVMVRGHAKPDSTIKINGQETYVHEDGTFERQVLLPSGVQVVKISNTDENGKTLTYVKEVDVQEDYFFMVGMGEGELGARDVSSHLESISEDDQFDDGFYQDRRIAYYLKAKVKGKYLITSSLDTDRSNNTKLFTNIDPDRYYPVYGDSATLDYEATDTQSKLFLLLEADKSYFKWGSFQTGFTDTQLATYNRTLSGAKFHLEREKTNQYGDTYGEVTGFYANSDAAPDHNEFLGTGGSLYYLKNRNLIEGSEKINVITRDKITGQITSSVDLVEGVDYEIDYFQGRIILTRPLSSVSGSNTIISSDILDGNTSFLVVDYEYHPSSPLENPSRGVKAHTQALENLRVGGTYVQDDHEGPNYKLLGADAIYKIGRRTKFTAEYAQSRSDQSSTNLSTDGGITFTNEDPTLFGTITGNTGNLNVTMDELSRISPTTYLNFDPDAHEAYSMKFQTGVSNKLTFKSYYTYVQRGFSSTSVLFQEGTQKIGGELSYRLAPATFFNLRHDTQKLIDDSETTVGLSSPTTISGVNGLSGNLLEGEENYTTTAQITHDIGKWGLIGEYRHQEIGSPVNQNDPLSDFFFVTNESDDIIAGRATYHWSGKFIPFIEQQVSLAGSDNHQTTAGADMKITEKIWLQAQETVGNRGNSTLVGLQAQTSEKTRVYVNQMIGFDDALGHATRTTYGSHTQVDSKSTFTTEKQYTTYRKGELESNLFGYETRLKEGWSFSGNYERIDSDNGFNRDAVSGTLGYTKWNKLNLFTKLEFRQDETSASLTQHQYLTQNLAKWQTTDDLSLLGRFNYGFTNDTTHDTTLGEFWEAGTGFAYRPIYFDRFNMLGKYTYLNDDQPNGQSDFGLDILEHSHLTSIEGIYDLNRWFQVVEKYAFKYGEVSVEGSDFFEVKTHLWINRLNFHVTRKWDIAGEFRLRRETSTDDQKTGFLIEVDREVIDYVRFGAGYNFTDFSDDLKSGSDDHAHGFFFRLTGKY